MTEFANQMDQLAHDVVTIGGSALVIAFVVIGPFALVGFLLWIHRKK